MSAKIRIFYINGDEQVIIINIDRYEEIQEIRESIKKIIKNNYNNWIEFLDRMFNLSLIRHIEVTRNIGEGLN